MTEAAEYNWCPIAYQLLAKEWWEAVQHCDKPDLEIFLKPITALRAAIGNHDKQPNKYTGVYIHISRAWIKPDWENRSPVIRTNTSQGERPIDTPMRPWTPKPWIDTNHDLPTGQLRIITYNCQSLKRTGRLCFLLHVLRNYGIIFLQGTCLKAEPGIPIQETHQAGFYCLSAGWTMRTNCKAGVMICFNKRQYKPDDIKYLNYPTDKHIAGRFLGCRILNERKNKCDLFYATTYYPPWTGVENKHTTQLQLHLKKVCQALQARTEPIIVGDFNCRFGRWNDNNKRTPPGKGSVYGIPQKETPQGSELRKWALELNLCAANTFAGPHTNGHESTFYSGTCKGVSSTCDYVFCSQRSFAAENICNIEVPKQLGKVLQMSHALHNIDHIPITFQMKYKVDVRYNMEEKEHTYWNFDNLFNDVMTGRTRAAFFKRLEAYRTFCELYYSAL